MKFRRLTSLLLVFSFMLSTVSAVKGAEVRHAEIIFGSEITEQLISSDIVPEVTERNGIEGIILDPDKTSTNLNLAMNTAVSGFKNGECVKVSVTYYDEGNGKFALYYDGMNGVIQHEDIVRLTNSEQWLTKTYFIQNPRFKKGIKGGFDLQLAMNTTSMSKSGGKAIISKVEVDLTDRYSVYDIKLSCDKPGNNYFTGEDIEFKADFKLIQRMQVDSYDCDAYYEVRDEYERVCWTGEEKNFNLRFGSETVIHPEITKYGQYHLYVTLKNEEHNYETVTRTHFSYIVASEKNADFGVTSHYAHSYPDPDKAVYIAEKSGIGILRDGIYWSAYEKRKGVYNTAGAKMIPEFYSAIIKSEVDLLQVAIAGNTLYSSSTSEIPCTEEAVNAYAEYCAKIALEAKPEAIEIWNEPNTTKFGLPTEFATYTAMMKAAYKRIKEVAPDVKVIGCCLMSSPTIPLDILGQIFDAGGGDYMDAVSVHPYMWVASPANGDYESKLTILNNFLAERGYPDMEVWVTELGYGGGPGVDFTKEQQAANLVQGYVMSKPFNNFGKFMWYDFQDDGLKEDDREDNFGLVKNWDSREPWGANKILLAMANMNNLLGSTEFAGKVSDNKDEFIYHFEDSAEDIYVAFSNRVNYTFGFKTDREYVKCIDMIGNESTIYAKDGVVNILGGEVPVYIVGENLELTSTEPTVNLNTLNAEFAYGEDAEIKSDFGKVECDNVNSNILISENENSLRVSFDEYSTVSEKLMVRVTESEKTYLEGKIDVKCLGLVTAEILNDLFSMNNFNRWIGNLKITNNSKEKPIEGKFSFTAPDIFSEKLHEIKIPEIKPGETKEIEFNFPEIIRKEAYNLNGVITLNDDYKRNVSGRVDFAVATYAEKKPVIDGVVNEDEWNLKTAMDMMYQNQAVNISGFRWGGVDDLSGRVCIEYDEDNFYFAAIMKDDVFCQPHNDNFIWKGDGIQFGTAYTRANGNELSTAFSELSFALTEEGEKIFMTIGEDVTFKVGEMNQEELGIECKIKREGNITSYELKLPRVAFTPLEAVFEDGKNIAFSMLVNDNDGLGRKGWLEYASGIGMNKNVTLFTFLKMIRK